jgi:hypothetical protein
MQNTSEERLIAEINDDSDDAYSKQEITIIKDRYNNYKKNPQNLSTFC